MTTIKSNISTKTWTKNDSDLIYNVSRWGDNYFHIKSNGHLGLRPERNTTGPQIDLKEVISEIKKKGINFPCVVRFHDVLRNQVISLNKMFERVIKEAKYNNKFQGVFPIKVNQLREVVEEIVDAGKAYNFGLEAGSKAELMAALAYNSNPQALTILNGYKDESYLRLALLGRKMGRKIIIVVEKLSELDHIFKLADDMNITPIIGLRAKIATEGCGRWKNSSGDHAKFGLSIPEILSAFDYLKKSNQLQSLKLFHFHIGSQVTDIKKIKEAVTEGARIYSQLIKLGAPIEYFDVGGGLGVDYDGTKSMFDSSTNYNLEDYVEDIVYILKEICDQESAPHPVIVSESGRYITAPHSCLLINVFGKIEVSSVCPEFKKSKDEHYLVKSMREYEKELNQENYQFIYNDALITKEESLNAFRLGVLNLEERSQIECLFWGICEKILKYIGKDEFAPDEIKKLKTKLAAQYLCNFSVFQSLADSWAIGQLFPIVPITRLNEEPTVRATLADITCDSDGKIDKFIDFKKSRKTILFHELKPNEDYHLGIFLTGAYQDIMGDMHNLFGRLNEVHIYSDDEDPEDFYIEEVIRGSRAKEVLETMQYSTTFMSQVVKKELDNQVTNGIIRPKEAVDLTDFYVKALKEYTYLN